MSNVMSTYIDIDDEWLVGNTKLCLATAGLPGVSGDSDGSDADLPGVSSDLPTDNGKLHPGDGELLSGNAASLAGDEDRSIDGAGAPFRGVGPLPEVEDELDDSHRKLSKVEGELVDGHGEPIGGVGFFVGSGSSVGKKFPKGNGFLWRSHTHGDAG